MLLSVDLETTGLEDSSNIIEFAAVLEDRKRPVEELQHFHCFVLNPRYDFEIIAASMNSRVIEKIAAFHRGERDKTEQYVPYNCLTCEVENWLERQGWHSTDRVTFTGKNFATFDKKFLDRIEFFQNIKMHHRVLDPGSMYWIPEIDGDTVPGTDVCLERAGLDFRTKHDALGDARNVLRLIRKKI